MFQLHGLSPAEPMTDMQMPLVAEDMYHHISEASVLGLPMYITETGLADNDDTLRKVCIETYYQQVGNMQVLAGYKLSLSAITRCWAGMCVFVVHYHFAAAVVCDDDVWVHDAIHCTCHAAV